MCSCAQRYISVIASYCRCMLISVVTLPVNLPALTVCTSTRVLKLAVLDAVNIARTPQNGLS